MKTLFALFALVAVSASAAHAASSGLELRCHLENSNQGGFPKISMAPLKPETAPLILELIVEKAAGVEPVKYYMVPSDEEIENLREGIRRWGPGLDVQDLIAYTVEGTETVSLDVYGQRISGGQWRVYAKLRAAEREDVLSCF